MKKIEDREELSVLNNAGVEAQSKKKKSGKTDTKTITEILSTGALTTAALLAPQIAAPVALTAAMLSLTKAYSSLPVNKKLSSVDVVSDTWKSRSKANTVKWLMQHSDTSLEKVAEYLGCTVHYLNNKLTRDSFSYEDMILIAYACGYTYVLVNNNEEADIPDSYRVDLIGHFQNGAPETLKRIAEIEEKARNGKREEYERKKAELEKMKKEYGFED
ncbi:MAG: hypothetical protein K6C08_06270 [Oscillospiraceae bacterium]|nr:hypothetical protein [Oscillospiraceae bacterium]